MLAPALAFAAAAAAVAGAWEALAAVERTLPAAAAARLLEPLRRAGREGREPTPPERRRLALVAAGTLLAIGWLAAGPVAGVLLALAGPAAALAVVRARRRRYAAALRAGAPGAARALADAIGAGHSPRGAIAAVAADVSGAAGRELRIAAARLALGDRTEAVLEALRRRAASPAWDTLVAAILVQRDAGGDLAGLLRRLAASLESAARHEADARAATAQARFTALVVAGMPAGAAALTELAAPGFVPSLLANPVSAALAGLAALLQVAAIVAVRRLARPPR